MWTGTPDAQVHSQGGLLPAGASVCADVTCSRVYAIAGLMLSEAKTEDAEVDGGFVPSRPEVSDPRSQRSGGQSRNHSGGLLPPAAISPGSGHLLPLPSQGSRWETRAAGRRRAPFIHPGMGASYR